MSFGIYTGNCYEASVLTLREAKSAARKMSAYRKMKAYVVREETAPDGGHRVTAPVMAGTWGGHCGSSFWVDDPEHTLIVEQSGVRGPARTSQAWHRRIVRGESAKDLGGFRVECQHRYDEKHSCSVPTPGGEISWNWEDNIRFTIQAAWEVEGKR